MNENLYFEGSETFFADLESWDAADENIVNAIWVSQR
jgi:hypothetical protein